jgi:hypothetical protein
VSFVQALMRKFWAFKEVKAGGVMVIQWELMTFGVCPAAWRKTPKLQC